MWKGGRIIKAFRPSKRKCFWVIGAFVAFAFLGYLSNYISALACQKKARADITQEVRSRAMSPLRPIVWVDDEKIVTHSCEDLWGATCGFEVFGVQVPSPWFYPDQYNYFPDDSTMDYFARVSSDPYAFIKLRKWDLPFIIPVYYGWGETAWYRTGVKYYFGFMGITIELTDILLIIV